MVGIILSHKNSTLGNYPELISLNKEYLAGIDKDLGLHYLDEFFRILHQEITQRNTVQAALGRGENLNRVQMMERKIEFMNQHLLNLGSVPGLYERTQLYQFLLNNVFDRSEKRFISQYLVDNPDGSIGINVSILPIPSEEEAQEYEEIRNENGNFALARIK